MFDTCSIVYEVLRLFSDPLTDAILLGSNGSSDPFACILCTLLVNTLEKYSQLNDTPLDEFIMNGYCTLFDKSLQSICQAAISVNGYNIITALERSTNPDQVCREIGQCSNPQCNLYPVDFQPSVKLSGQDIAYPPCSNIDVRKLLAWSFLDFDDDSFSSNTATRGGYNWKGRDCADIDSQIYPGRSINPYPYYEELDYNCNGISGVDAATGRSNKDLLCENTTQLGIILAGDSAGAHFNLPRKLFDPSRWESGVLDDLSTLIQDDFDTPQYGAFTGFCPDGSPQPCSSVYKHLYERNKCNFRDYQNLAVNGATINTTLDNIQSLARNKDIDKPVLFILELLANDICSLTMTSPKDFRQRLMEILVFLEDKLPEGSHLVVIGLVEDDIYNILYNKVHISGVTFADFYNFGACLGAPTCPGLLSANQSLREEHLNRAKELNEVYREVLGAFNSQTFDSLFYEIPKQEIIQEIVDQGKDASEAFNSVDGFHPSQLLNSQIADHLWEFLVENRPEWLGEVNPNNEKIEEMFGDQGGH